MVSQRHILTSNCQLLLWLWQWCKQFSSKCSAVLLTATGSSLRIYILCKLWTVFQTSTNKKYCITVGIQIWNSFGTRALAFISGAVSKGVCNFSERTRHFLVYRKTDAGGKTLREVRVRERERGGGAKTSTEFKWSMRSDRREPGGSDWEQWLELVWLAVATRLFHFGTVQLAAVADHSLRPMHLTSSLWVLSDPWKDQQIFVLNFQAAMVHFQWQISWNLGSSKINLHQLEPC